jgi:amino acid transporter
MKKLELKWKLFLVANYFQMVLTLLTILIALFGIVSNKNPSTPTAIFLFLILFFLVCLICLFNIILLNRYFPNNPLPRKWRKMLNLCRIAMVLITSLLAFIIIGLFSLYSDPSKGGDLPTILGLIFFGLLFLLSLYITILQFQVSKYLNQQSTGNVNQLIDSIGR